MKIACKNCRHYLRFFNDDGDEEAMGECHKNTPVVFMSKRDEPETYWPEVAEDNFCGKFRPYVMPPKAPSPEAGEV